MTQRGITNTVRLPEARVAGTSDKNGAPLTGRDKRVARMRISGRLAFEPDLLAGGVNRSSMGYHGCNIIVHSISESGFSGDFSHALPLGALVRLRLPGAGVLVARVGHSGDGRIEASFVNPVPPSRLGKTLGISSHREPAYA